MTARERDRWLRVGTCSGEQRLKRYSIDFRNSIKSIIFHKLSHARARNMYQNVHFINSNWSLTHINIYLVYSCWMIECFSLVLVILAWPKTFCYLCGWIILRYSLDCVKHMSQMPTHFQKIASIWIFWRCNHTNFQPQLPTQSKTYSLHFRMFTEYPQTFLKGAI